MAPEIETGSVRDIFQKRPALQTAGVIHKFHSELDQLLKLPTLDHEKTEEPHHLFYDEDTDHDSEYCSTLDAFLSTLPAKDAAQFKRKRVKS